MGGLIGRVIDATRVLFQGANVTSVRVNPGAGDNRTAQQFGPAGDISLPLPEDFAYMGPLPRAGGFGALGYLDPAARSAVIVTASENPGGKRLYARSADGQISAVIEMGPDGRIGIANTPGGTLKATLEFTATGGVVITSASGQNINLNGVTINNAGEISAAKVSAPSIEANGVEVAGHQHTQPNDAGGDVEQPTNPMGS